MKKLLLVNRFDQYRQAKSEIRRLRESQQPVEDRQWQMIFAESELQAEELLQEKRPAPVLMEWEK